MASGRGSNFDALLAAARDSGGPVRIVLLISDKAGAPVVERARDAGLTVEVVDPGTRRGAWTAEGVQGLLDALHRHDVGLICLAGFMRILPVEIVRAFPDRILNIHPSLLPAFPGLRPQRQALEAGVKLSGCTVHLVDEDVDTGPIVLQAAVPVLDDDNEDRLAARILHEEHRIYPAAVRAIAEGRLRKMGRRVHLQSPTESPT
jgi:phosphoribosylglycinamide formyltransferase-1